MHIFFFSSQQHNEKLFQYFDIWNFPKLHLEGIHFVFRQTRYLGPGLGCKTEMLKGQRTKQLWSQACRKETTNGARQPLSCSRTGMAIINYVPESRGSLPGSKALTMLFRVHKIVQLCAGGGNTFIWGQCGVPLAWICDKDIRLSLETRVTTIWKAAGAKTCRAVKGKITRKCFGGFKLGFKLRCSAEFPNLRLEKCRRWGIGSGNEKVHMFKFD